MADLQVRVAPEIRVVLDGQEHRLSGADILLPGDDLATLGDDTLKERVARWLDRPVSVLSGMVVTRPATGNILISPKAVFGED